ncbi:hypothetical protein [Alteromonas sp. BMJM2]|uniref:hypothetical protein n=1 Tax=Alteromonas sp. BMJM2 TaxID=2954241 RepID=UPI0022B5042B|nr:hypothetical protein [Alteromonas sp. BMJM2]
MNKEAHFFSISGYNFNLPKRKDKTYNVNYMHRNATNHDELAINRLKMLFQKEGFLFEQSCREISNSNTVMVRAHIIFFADRSFDFRRSERFKKLPKDLPPANPGVTLSFSGADLHNGIVRIPDEETLRKIALMQAPPFDRKSTMSGAEYAQHILKFNRKKSAYYDQVQSKCAVRPSDCEYTRGKTGVNLYHYYYKTKYNRLYQEYGGISSYPKTFGGFLRLFDWFVEAKDISLSPLAKEFVRDLSDHIDNGELAKVQNVLSISDIYAAIEELGKARSIVLELSIFSHAWWGGPVLVNSFDERSDSKTGLWFKYDSNSAKPSEFAQKFSDAEFIAAPIRNPYDKDARSEYDFVSSKIRFQHWLRSTFPDGADNVHGTLDDEQLKWLRKQDFAIKGNLAQRNAHAQKSFNENSRVLLWGCSAVRVHKKLIDAFLRSDSKRYRKSFSNKENIKQRLTQYWSQQLSLWQTDLEGPKIGDIENIQASGISSYYEHINQVSAEKPPLSHAYQQSKSISTSPLGLKYGLVSPCDPLPESNESMKSSDRMHNVVFRASDTPYIYGLSSPPKYSDWEELKSNSSFIEALGIFGPFPEESNALASISDSKKYWQRYVDERDNANSIFTEEQLRKVLTAVSERFRHSWTIQISPCLIPEYMAIYQSFNWILSLSWSVKVHSAPPGTGTLFQSQRSDSVFKSRVSKAKKRTPKKVFYPLNDIGYQHKNYRGYAEKNQARINFYRELFGVDTAKDEILNETIGYFVLDPKDTSFWNFVSWPAIRDALRVEWLDRQNE